MSSHEDVIAAIATPLGEGGLSVIRISGPGAVEVADRGFSGKSALRTVQSHTAHHGFFRDAKGEDIDEVVATVFLAPHSYTGENSVEISCHGGGFIARKLLSAVLENGARLAGPGEFTKRAFLNGRMDLAQAEAVAELIRARSEIAHKRSMSQLRGKLSGRVGNLREKLLKVCGLLEAELDFVEEGIQFTDKAETLHLIDAIITDIDGMAAGFGRSRIYREGAKVVLLGRPNVGKSSILNMLVSERRAIVAELPGTTRDTIEEAVRVRGMHYQIVDTAGLRRDSQDLVENEGMQRALTEADTSDINILVMDSQYPPDKGDEELLASLLEKHAKVIIAINKIDIGSWREGSINAPASVPVVRISAKTGEGLGRLEDVLEESALGGNSGENTESDFLINSRHAASLKSARERLGHAREAVQLKWSNELVVPDIRGAIDCLGEIVGAVTSDDILDMVFSTFCIGK